MTATTLSDLPATEATAPRAVLDGAPMFWAGLIFGTANLAQYLNQTGELRINGPQTGMMWLGAVIAFVVLAFVLKAGVNRDFAKAPEVRRFRAVWGSLILGAVLAVSAAELALGRNGQFEAMRLIVAPIALMIYAAGWRIAAVMSGQPGYNLLSLASLLGGVGLALGGGQPWQPLAYALCLYALAMTPGLVLMRLSHTA